MMRNFGEYEVLVVTVSRDLLLCQRVTSVISDWTGQRPRRVSFCSSFNVQAWGAWLELLEKC